MQFSSFKYTSFLLLAAILLNGCTSTDTLYHWGNYEGLLYKMYNEPGEATPEVQIERLIVDIQKAEAYGKKVPPGVFAHLGVMYAANGNLAKAQEAFIEEKTLFPEAAVLVDGMILRSQNSYNSK
ncbi:DUF4810 domain-containing protein [Agarilytica rhodophyticola]|uniref:DUF4810 domain-containing protein n=1 Tax=Agarilytica rhodophyticola TaxID=1737490 RepID=UPI000B349107|nr:DUF4810 domain-containing protein [Agarilytica rhodophyticola]